MINLNIFPPLLFSLWFFPGFIQATPDKIRFPENYKKAILFFGQGGGITGAVTTYALLDNGRVFKKNTLTQPEFVYQGKLTRSDTRQLFNNYTFLGLDNVQTGEPGNIYHFVEYQLKNKRHKLTWGGPTPVPANLTLFYTLLNHYLPKT